MTSASAEQTLFTLEGFDQQAAASVATPAATGVNKLSAIQTGIRSRCFKSLAEDLSAFHEFRSERLRPAGGGLGCYSCRNWSQQAVGHSNGHPVALLQISG